MGEGKLDFGMLLVVGLAVLVFLKPELLGLGKKRVAYAGGSGDLLPPGMDFTPISPDGRPLSPEQGLKVVAQVNELRDSGCLMNAFVPGFGGACAPKAVPRPQTQPPIAVNPLGGAGASLNRAFTGFHTATQIEAARTSLDPFAARPATAEQIEQGRTAVAGARGFTGRILS